MSVNSHHKDPCGWCGRHVYSYQNAKVVRARLYHGDCYEIRMLAAGSSRLIGVEA